MDELLKEGASHGFVTDNNPDLNKEIIKAAGGAGVDAIFDCVVGELALKVLNQHLLLLLLQFEEPFLLLFCGG